MSDETENEVIELELPPTEAELRHREVVALWRAYYDAAELYDRSIPHWPAPSNAFGGSRGVLVKGARPNAPSPEPVEASAIALVGSYTASARAARDGLEEHERSLEWCACGDLHRKQSARVNPRRKESRKYEQREECKPRSSPGRNRGNARRTRHDPSDRGRACGVASRSRRGRASPVAMDSPRDHARDDGARSQAPCRERVEP